MTKHDLLQLILAAADDVGRMFDHAEIVTWPPNALDEMRNLGLLRAAAVGMTAPCPHCSGGHTEPVIIRAGPDGRDRYFIRCPESLRVEVSPAMCRAWEIDPGGLATAIGAAMSLPEKPKPVVPDRLWRLGRTPWQSGTREVLLARRLHDGDAPQVVRHVGQGGRAIVLVPHMIPGAQMWPGRAPAVIGLSRVTSLGDEGIELEVAAMMEMVRDADDQSARMSALPLDPEKKKLVVRQQLKAELKSHLSDDALVAAYLKHGSLRKAAQELTEQLDVPISKDKVRRAVERHGGLAEIVPEDDSPSIARTVASRSRDRGRKFIERR